MIGIAAVLAVSINSASAAELGVTTKQTIVRAHRHVVVHKHRYFGTWKSVGYPCLLPPHVIVRSNWNGPQCRYVDNIIFP